MLIYSSAFQVWNLENICFYASVCTCKLSFLETMMSQLTFLDHSVLLWDLIGFWCRLGRHLLFGKVVWPFVAAFPRRHHQLHFICAAVHTNLSVSSVCSISNIWLIICWHGDTFFFHILRLHGFGWRGAPLDRWMSYLFFSVIDAHIFFVFAPLATSSTALPLKLPHIPPNIITRRCAPTTFTSHLSSPSPPTHIVLLSFGFMLCISVAAPPQCDTSFLSMLPCYHPSFPITSTF